MDTLFWLVVSTCTVQAGFMLVFLWRNRRKDAIAFGLGQLASDTLAYLLKQQDSLPPSEMSAGGHLLKVLNHATAEVADLNGPAKSPNDSPAWAFHIYRQLSFGVEMFEDAQRVSDLTPTDESLKKLQLAAREKLIEAFLWSVTSLAWRWCLVLFVLGMANSRRFGRQLQQKVDEVRRAKATLRNGTMPGAV